MLEKNDSRTAEEASFFKKGWSRLVDMLESLTPQGRIDQANNALIQSIQASGAATQLWMTEIARRQMQQQGSMTSENSAILDQMSRQYANNMRENGADPVKILNSVAEIDRT